MEIPFVKEKMKSPSPNLGMLTPSNSHILGASPPSSLQRPKKDIWILVAEDNKINQVIALKTLKKYGYQAKAAENGQEALEMLAERTFDLILMDVQVSFPFSFLENNHFHQMYFSSCLSDFAFILRSKDASPRWLRNNLLHKEFGKDRNKDNSNRGFDG